MVELSLAIAIAVVVGAAFVPAELGLAVTPSGASGPAPAPAVLESRGEGQVASSVPSTGTVSSDPAIDGVSGSSPPSSIGSGPCQPGPAGGPPYVQQDCILNLTTEDSPDVLILFITVVTVGNLPFLLNDPASPPSQGLSWVPRTGAVGSVSVPGAGCSPYCTLFDFEYYAIASSPLENVPIYANMTGTIENPASALAFGVSGANTENPFDANPSVPSGAAYRCNGPSSASPEIDLLPACAPVGTTVAVSGYGFQSGDTSVVISGLGSPVTCPVSGGAIVTTPTPCLLTVPADAVGSYGITATGSSLLPSDVATTYFTVSDVSLSTSSCGDLAIGLLGMMNWSSGVGSGGTPFAPVGPALFAEGQGAFSSYAGSMAYAEYDASVPQGTITVGAVWDYGIPYALLADAIVPANPPACAPPPTLTLTPSSGGDGTLVAARGSGFESDKPVTFTFDDSPVTSDCSTGTLGNFPGATGTPCTFEVPVTAFAGDNGGRNVVATTVSAEYAAAASYTVVARELALYPVSGGDGTVVTASGAGFAPDSTVSFTFDGGGVASVCSTGPLGYFPGTTGTPCTFDVPASAPVGDDGGFNAVASTTDGTIFASETYTVVPTVLALYPLSGGDGTLVTASGSGFEPDSTVSFTFDGVAVASDCSTGPKGSFPGITGTPCTFDVPAAAPTGDDGGSNVVASTGVSIAASESYTVVPRVLTLYPTSGPDGTLVTASGSGFEPDSTVSFTFDGVAVASDCSTGPKGSFPGITGTPCTFDVPAAASTGDDGGSNVVATTGSPISASTSFTVTPPLGASASGPPSSAVATGFTTVAGAAVAVPRP